MSSLQNDLFVKFEVATKRILNITVAMTIFLVLSYKFGWDVVVFQMVKVYVDVSQDLAIWLFYLLSSSAGLLLNLLFIFQTLKSHIFTGGEWSSFVKFFAKKWKVYDFRENKFVYRHIPRYVYAFFIFLFIFGLVSAINYMFVSPLRTILIQGDSEAIFQFQPYQHPSLFIYMMFPPYLIFIVILRVKRK